MSAKRAAVIGSLLLLVAASPTTTAQPYQPDDPVPPGAVFRIVDLQYRTVDLQYRIVDLQYRIVDLQFRVEAAPEGTTAGGGKATGIASGPHSTMSSDFLYLPANPDAVATLTIRVADQQGQPLQGKRVEVTSAVSGEPADTILQPEAPTDARGITTARVKPVTPPHTARFSARVLEDNVDIGQVVEIEVQKPGPPSFFPAAFAPYFGEGFHVSPTPLVVGRPTTITVPLTNRWKVPVEVRVRFFATVLNIGLGHWPQIGETETFVLQPGESRDAKITWTPTVESGHLCVKVEVWGRALPAQADAGAWPGLVSAAYAAPIALAQAAGAPAPIETRSQNLGTVSLPPCGPLEYGTDHVPIHASPCVPSRGEKWYCENTARVYAGRKHVESEYYTKNFEAEFNEANIYRFKIPELLDHMDAVIKKLLKCAADPLDPEYEQLAAAASDTAAGYLEAVIISMERYQGAEAAGDREWMARHLTARRLYLKRHAEALRRAADAMQKSAESLPPDEPGALSTVQAAQDRFFERWRRGERFSQDQRKWFKEVGISEERATAAIDTLAASKEIPPAKSLRTLLLETATLDRESADEAERVARPGGSTGVEGKAGAPVSQTYLVGNPHDREETVDLFIRRASVPPEWKLSIVDAEPASVGQPQTRVQEVEAGRHYRVRLPAKGQLTVASVVVPVGIVGENTWARWADEGKIGDELIGGIVHEMHVPGFLADLKLPPVAPAPPSPAAASPAGAARWVMPAAIAAAALLAVAIVVVLLVRFRRKGATGP